MRTFVSSAGFKKRIISIIYNSKVVNYYTQPTHLGIELVHWFSFHLFFLAQMMIFETTLNSDLITIDIFEGIHLNGNICRSNFEKYLLVLVLPCRKSIIFKNVFPFLWHDNCAKRIAKVGSFIAIFLS